MYPMNTTYALQQAGGCLTNIPPSLTTAHVLASISATPQSQWQLMSPIWPHMDLGFFLM